MPLPGSSDRPTDAKTRPVRVVHVIEATEGGTRRWLENVVLGLDSARIEQSCICSVRRDRSFMETIEKFRAHGVNVWITDMRRGINPWYDLLATWRIARILREDRFDVVHAHSSKAGVLARLAARLVRVRPVVYTPHAFSFLAGSVFSPMFSLVERAMCPLTDRLVAVSESERQFSLRLGYSPKNVVTIPNGVRAPNTDSPPSTSGASVPVVGTVTSFRPQKDPVTFVRACAVLRERGRTIRAVACGDGPFLPETKRLAAQMGLADSVEFPRWVDDVFARLATWDVFVLSTHYEGLSYALLEAMSAGKPIIGSRVPGVEEVIEHRQTGLLVPPGDPDALATAIWELLDDRPLAQRLGATARERAIERYSLDMQLDRLTNLYETLGKEFSNIECKKTSV